MRYKQFTCAHLKRFALIFMALGNAGAIFSELDYYSPFTRIVSALHTPLRIAGSMAFPLFLFCLVEGFYYTKNRVNYLKRLLLFAVISEVPYDYGMYGEVVYWGSNNVLWTLSLVFLCCMVFDKIRKQFPGKTNKTVRMMWTALVIAGFSVVAMVTHVSFGAAAIWAGAALYWLQDTRLTAFLAETGCLVLFSVYQLFGLLACPLIYRYNGKKGKQNKYFFYLFYPAHLLLLRGICLLLA